MATLRRSVKWLLFGSSYIPLFIILAAKGRELVIDVSGTQIPVLSLLMILLILVTGLSLWAVLHVRGKREGDWVDIQAANDRNDLITTYLLVYIFPFIILDYADLYNILAFVAFFLTIGVIQVRSNHLFVNPVLALFGYDLIEVQDPAGHHRVVLTKDQDVRPGRVLLAEITGDIYLAK